MKILIISPSWIGDTVISHSLYRLLYIKYHAQIQIDVIVSMQCKFIIDRMPEINEIFITPYKHRMLELRKYSHLGNLLKNKKYHQSIVLPNSLKSSIIPFLANIPIRTGWRGEMRYGLLNDLRILNKESLPLLVQRYAALAYDRNDMQSFLHYPYLLPLPTLHIKKKETQNILSKFNLNKNKKKLIGLCPGSASGPSKNWPHYHYITLAIQLILYGYHVVILGSFQDELIKIFMDMSTLKYLKKYYHNLIGSTSLDEAIIILASCKVIVSNDSGLMHIACALKRPVIGLYGPTNPNVNPPLFYKSKIICNTVQDHRCQEINLKKDLYGYPNSLISITPNHVFKTLQKLLY